MIRKKILATALTTTIVLPIASQTAIYANEINLLTSTDLKEPILVKEQDIVKNKENVITDPIGFVITEESTGHTTTISSDNVGNLTKLPMNDGNKYLISISPESQQNYTLDHEVTYEVKNGNLFFPDNKILVKRSPKTLNIDVLMIMKDNDVLTEPVCFKFEDLTDGTNFTKESNNSMLLNINFKEGHKYKISIDNNTSPNYKMDSIEVIPTSKEGIISLNDTKGQVVGFININDNTTTTNTLPNIENNLLKSANVKVVNNGSPVSDFPIRLFRWDSPGIPNIISSLESDSKGECTFTNLQPNTKYEIRMGPSKLKLTPNVYTVETNKLGEIYIVNGKPIDEYTKNNGFIFSSSSEDSVQKTTKVTFKVFDKLTNKPVDGAEFTANTIYPRLASYKTVKSKNGEVTFDLEGGADGVQYSVCLSKNGQFFYNFEPQEITFSIDENLNVSKMSAYALGGNTHIVTDTFYVTPYDQSHLRQDLKDKLAEAKEKRDSGKYTEDSISKLNTAILRAEYEVSRAETIPEYTSSALSSLELAINQLKEIASYEGTSHHIYNSTEDVTSSPVKKIDRIAGENRITTALELSKKKYKKSDNVIIVDSNNYTDALSATVLATKLKAPILFADTTISKDVIDELTRLSAKNVVIVGGVSSVSIQVEKELNSYKIDRISGKDRYETSRMVAERILKNSDKKELFLASGNDFPDALSATPLAAKNNVPIVLVPKSQADAGFKNFLKKQSVKKVTIIGGQESIGAYADKIDGISTERLYGKNRYETSSIIAKEFGVSSLYVTTGKNYVDSLASGPIAFMDKSPIMLVDYESSEQTKNFIKNNKVESVTIVGGEQSISQKLVNLIFGK